MPSKNYATLIQLVRDVYTATSIEGLLDWDQETYMPPKAAQTRAAQMAFIAGVGHERLTGKKFARLLEKAEQEQDGDPVTATNIREMRRIYDRKGRVCNVDYRQLNAVIGQNVIDPWFFIDFRQSHF